MTVNLIRVSDILSATELLAEYAAECSIPEIGPPNPQAAMYEAMQNAGFAQAFGAYRGGNLVGFSSLLTTILPHYGRKVATQESLFLAKDARSGQLGRELMQADEEYARRSGSVAMLRSALAGSRLEKLLSMSDDYRRTNSVFCKSL